MKELFSVKMLIDNSLKIPWFLKNWKWWKILAMASGKKTKTESKWLSLRMKGEFLQK